MLKKKAARLLGLILSLNIMFSNAVVYAAELDINGKVVPDTESDELLKDSWYIENIGCYELWNSLDEKGKQPGQEVIVAVIDSGLDITNTDLKASLWCNTKELEGEDGVDDDGNGYVDDIYGVNLANYSPKMTDINGHGTQVAGIIAMQPGNGGGVGVSYGVKIMPIKASIDTNYSENTIIEALEYAVNMGADVINMSFATYRYSEKLEAAMRKASESCVLVAAAGNEQYVTNGEILQKQDLTEDGFQVGDTYPAAWDCCIGVMAYDQNERLADFSNWDQANKYDIIAPGEQILTTSRLQKHVTVKGTSFSTAIVSAAVAALKSMVGERVSAPQLKEMFLSTMTHHIDYTYRENVFSYPKCMMSDLAPYISYQEGEEIPKETEIPEETEAPKETELPEETEDQKETELPKETEILKETELPEETELSNVPEGIKAPEYSMNSDSSQKEEAKKTPKIRKIYKSSKKVHIVFQYLPKECRTSIIFSQKRNGKEKKYIVRPKKKRVAISKAKLKKKLYAKGKITIRISYKQSDQKTVIRKVKNSWSIK